MIPKIIHYCWFGRNKKTKVIKKCIKSWKKFCPDYKIIEWNETNFDIDKSCRYVKEAYDKGKWAFVSDYVRLWVVYNYGGIYLDTDVELIKNIDFLLKKKGFFAFQDNQYIATGLGFGSEKGSLLIKSLLNDYEKTRFVLKNNEIDLTPCPVRNTKVIKEYFNKDIKSNVIECFDDIYFYPKEYFSPIDCKTMIMNKTENTVAIHWFAASWLDSDYLIQREYNEFYFAVRNVMGEKSTYLFVVLFYMIFRHKKWVFLNKKWKNSL